MKLFDVYPLYDVTPVRAKDVYVYDENGTEYLDLYGGHAVISIGHGHPRYLERLTQQMHQIGFYSNAIHNPLQQELPIPLENIHVAMTINCFCAVQGLRPMKMP